MLPKLATLAVLTLALTVPASAQAFTLGVGDGAQFAAADSQTLGATTYRVVIDPALGLDAYAPRIQAHRAAGQEPQIVIGGTGTEGHAYTHGVIATAVAAAKRWPSAYSISVINEPNESGISVCEYTRLYAKAYKALKAAGARRVLFGEWSPNNALGWQHATLTRCGKASKALKGKVGNVAWHGYGEAINDGRQLRAMTQRIARQRPKLYVTEAGFMVSYQGVVKTAAAADNGGTRYWRHALKVAKAELAQIVVWELHDSPVSSAWNSGLIDAGGRQRPAFQLLAGR